MEGWGGGGEGSWLGLGWCRVLGGMGSRRGLCRWAAARGGSRPLEDSREVP